LENATQPPRPTVLVVEDDVTSRKFLAELLERQGYAVGCAGDGCEALAYLRAHPAPGVILLDLHMPVLDGRAFRRRQRQDPALAPIPVVVISAHAETARGEGSLGDVAFLQKPVDADELLATVGRLAAPPAVGVLVVEDEPAVAKMLEVALPHYGLRVWCAGGCEEAVRLFRENQSEVGVLLLDVQPDGPAALAAVRAIDPTVPAGFMTGNPGNYSTEDLLAMGAAKVLPKPFHSLPELAPLLRGLAQRD
jgi:CheY-like chemotaxis protein